MTAASNEVLEERLHNLQLDHERDRRDHKSELSTLKREHDEDLATLKSEFVALKTRTTQLVIAIATVMVALAGLLIGIASHVGK